MKYEDCEYFDDKDMSYEFLRSKIFREGRLSCLKILTFHGSVEIEIAIFILRKLCETYNA